MAGISGKLHKLIKETLDYLQPHIVPNDAAGDAAKKVGKDGHVPGADSKSLEGEYIPYDEVTGASHSPGGKGRGNGGGDPPKDRGGEPEPEPAGNGDKGKKKHTRQQIADLIDNLSPHKHTSAESLSAAYKELRNAVRDNGKLVSERPFTSDIRNVPGAFNEIKARMLRGDKVTESEFQRLVDHDLKAFEDRKVVHAKGNAFDSEKGPGQAADAPSSGFMGARTGTAAAIDLGRDILHRTLSLGTNPATPPLRWWVKASVAATAIGGPWAGLDYMASEANDKHPTQLTGPEYAAHRFTDWLFPDVTVMLKGPDGKDEAKKIGISLYSNLRMNDLQEKPQALTAVRDALAKTDVGVHPVVLDMMTLYMTRNAEARVVKGTEDAAIPKAEQIRQQQDADAEKAARAHVQQRIDTGVKVMEEQGRLAQRFSVVAESMHRYGSAPAATIVQGVGITDQSSAQALTARLTSIAVESGRDDGTVTPKILEKALLDKDFGVELASKTEPWARPALTKLGELAAPQPTAP